MSADCADASDLVVADDGSIPADQIAKLGVKPGTRLRVVAQGAVESSKSIRGSLTGWSDVTWEDFERGHELAIADAEGS